MPRTNGVVKLVAFVAASIAGVAFVNLWLIPHLRGNDVEICGRYYTRGGSRTDTEMQAYGPIHKVGESRIDEDLLAHASRWPNEDCAGPIPTTLYSKDGASWDVWGLRGGP